MHPAPPVGLASGWRARSEAPNVTCGRTHLVLGHEVRGEVEAYTTLDLVATYVLDERWTFGLNAANLLDSEHWEAFGGDLIGRRVLGSITFGF